MCSSLQSLRTPTTRTYLAKKKLPININDVYTAFGNKIIYITQFVHCKNHCTAVKIYNYTDVSADRMINSPCGTKPKIAPSCSLG